MKFIEVPQGTEAWYQARVGRITASCFAEAISVTTRTSGARKAGDPTAAAERYAADLAIERVSGQPHGEPIKAWVLERGHEMETRARMLYEARTGAFITEAGICVTDDGIFGYSTDGLAGDDGLIEIKAPIDSIKIVEMWRTGDVSEYHHQMQGGMWITGRQWCDFIMYVPDLSAVGKALYVKRIHRDEEFINSMVSQLSAFDDMVQKYEAVFRAPTAEVAETKQPEEPMTDIAPEVPAALTAAAELAAVQAAPEGAELSPAAQKLNEREGAARFAAAHPTLATEATAPTLRLGQISERLGFAVTADFLLSLGFNCKVDKGARLYHESDFKNICAALLRHIAEVQAKKFTVTL